MKPGVLMWNTYVKSQQVVAAGEIFKPPGLLLYLISFIHYTITAGNTNRLNKLTKSFYEMTDWCYRLKRKCSDHSNKVHKYLSNKYLIMTQIFTAAVNIKDRFFKHISRTVIRIFDAWLCLCVYQTESVWRYSAFSENWWHH